MSGRFYDGHGGRGGGYQRYGGGRGGGGYQGNRGGRGGGGGRGGWGGGRGGRGGGRDHRSVPDRQSMMQVQLNMYRLTVNDESRLHSDEWVQYVVEIRDAKRVKKKGPNGEFLDPFEFEITTLQRRGEEKIVDTARGDNPLSRKILVQLQQNLWKDEGKLLVSDGRSSAYSNKRLFEVSDEMDIEDNGDEEEKTIEPPNSIYGPADDGTPFNRPQAPKAGPHKTFVVSIKKDCEEADSYADQVKPSYYLVRLTEVCVIPNKLVRQFMENQISDFKETERLRQLMDTASKSAMFTTLIAEGRSPHLFYLPEDNQDEQMLGDLWNTYMGKKYSPFVGIAQATRFCQNGNVFLSCDAGLGWFDKESVNQKPVLILDEREKTIAGVRVPSFDRPITDDPTKTAIEEALKKLRIRMECGPPSEAWEKEQKERGKSEKWLSKRRTQSRPPTRMDCKQGIDSIIWSADKHYFNELPPRQWKSKDFTKKGDTNDQNKDGEEKQEENKQEEKQEEESKQEEKEEEVQGPLINMCDYWAQKKGITIKYPKMPLVLLKTRAKIDEYFPVEFLYQSFGKKKLLGADDHIEEILKWNDNFSASDRIDLTTKVKEIASELEDKSGLSLSQILRQFNFTCAKEPVTLQAKVLPEPTVTFNNKKCSPRNGSWDLKDVKFSSPSDMSSFVVVDFVGSGEQAVTKLLQVMKNHGMQTPSIFDEREPMLHNVTIRKRVESRPKECYGAFKEAMDVARDFYLKDAKGVFSRYQTWFRTRISVPDTENIVDCLVMFHNRHMELILPEEENLETHILTDRNGETKNARIKAIVNNDRDHPVDLFDIRGHQGCYEILDRGRWTRIRTIDFVWQVPETGELLTETDFVNRSTSISISAEEICEMVECPAMIIVYLQDDSKDLYNLVKMMCQFEFGVQSQCIVHKKYITNSRKDQYCSNVALKMNTKLFNLCNKGCAWDIDGGIPWVSEIPTLVFGVAMSHGQGQANISIIGASACLDQSCMPMAQTLKAQDKSDIISDAVMLSITKSLAIQFYMHTRQKPQRVLVFRDGASDGSFSKILQHEFAAIRRAFYELNLTEEGFACPNSSNCKGRGCVFCTPVITFVISQTQHNYRVTLPKREGYKTNVLSGTCVDDEFVMPFQNGLQLATKDVTKEEPVNANIQLFSDVKDTGYDFLLTPQGGLKGTSKPVFYRVLFNENAVCRPTGSGGSPLTKDALQKSVYHMSYMYGTATKSVRKVPVVHYSKRLAENYNGYIKYLLETEKIKSTSDDLNDPDGTFEDRVHYIREVDDDLINGRLTPELVSELLPKFSPYDEKQNSDLKWRVPFRPHVSA